MDNFTSKSKWHLHLKQTLWYFCLKSTGRGTWDSLRTFTPDFTQVNLFSLHIWNTTFEFSHIYTAGTILIVCRLCSDCNRSKDVFLKLDLVDTLWMHETIEFPRPPNNHDIKLPCRTVRFCPTTLMHILFDVIIITVSNLSVQRVWTDCRHLIESHLNAACGLFTDPDSLKSHISLSRDKCESSKHSLPLLCCWQQAGPTHWLRGLTLTTPAPGGVLVFFFLFKVAQHFLSQDPPLPYIIFKALNDTFLSQWFSKLHACACFDLAFVA